MVWRDDKSPLMWEPAEFCHAPKQNNTATKKYFWWIQFYQLGPAVCPYVHKSSQINLLVATGAKSGENMEKMILFWIFTHFVGSYYLESFSCIYSTLVSWLSLFCQCMFSESCIWHAVSLVTSYMLCSLCSCQSVEPKFCRISQENI